MRVPSFFNCSTASGKEVLRLGEPDSFTSQRSHRVYLRRPPRRLEAEETESGVDSPFDEPMVLLNEVVEIFTLSQSSAVGEDSFLLQFFNRRWVGFVLIDVDNSRRLMFESLEHFAEESFGRLRVSLRAEHEIDCLSGRIDRAVKIFPRAFHFDIGFIDAVGVIRRSQVRTTPFLQFRSISLDPSVDRRLIDCEVALLHHFFEVAITDGIAQIPANAQENNLRLVVTPVPTENSVRPLNTCI